MNNASRSLPRLALYCYTYAHRTHLLNLEAVYITGARESHSLVAAPEPARETHRVNTKRRLTAKQERQRTEGLRILARIIARHYLANPHLYHNGSTPSDGQQADDGKTARREDGE